MTSDYRLLFTLPATNTAEIKLGSRLLLLLTTPQPLPPGNAAATAVTPATAAADASGGAGVSFSTVAVGMGGGNGCESAAMEGEHDADLWWRSSKKRGSQVKAPRLLVYAAANGQVTPGHRLRLEWGRVLGHLAKTASHCVVGVAGGGGAGAGAVAQVACSSKGMRDKGQVAGQGYSAAGVRSSKWTSEDGFDGWNWVQVC